MATDYTTHYNLDKYTATDKPNLRDQYNAAMDKIDAELWSQHGDVADAKNAAQSALAQVASKAESSDLDAAKALLPAASFTSTNTVKKYIDDSVAAKANATDLDAAKALLPAGSFSSTNTVKKYIDDTRALLPAGSFSSTNTVKKYIDDRTKDYFGNTIIFGDSWNYMNNADQPWVQQFKAYAATHGFSVYNHAVSGSAYVWSGNLFSSQVSAATETDVRNVIVFGGLNDTRNASYNRGELWSAARALYGQIKTKWPNARIFVAGTQHGNSAYELKYTEATRTLGLAARISGCSFAAANYWLPTSDLYQDSLHPNANGHAIVFTHMMQLLGLGGTNGGDYIANLNYSVASGGSVSSFTDNFAVMQDGIFNAAFGLAGSVNASSNLTVNITGVSNFLLGRDVAMIIGGGVSSRSLDIHGYMLSSGTIRIVLENLTASAVNFANLNCEVMYTI